MKNQKGISMVTLVMTIVIAILLATIALNSGGSDVPDRAYFVGFASEMEDLQMSVSSEYAMVKQKEISRAHTVSDAQIYNYIARGGELASPPITKDSSGDRLWLTVSQAESISCTPLNRAYALEKLSIKKRKVSTAIGNDEVVSYFITPKGRVFCWPPYVSEDKSYVTARDYATTIEGVPFTGTQATEPGTIALITLGNEEDHSLEKIYVTTTGAAPALPVIVPITSTVQPSTKDSPAVYYIKGLKDSVTGGASMGYSFGTTP